MPVIVPAAAETTPLSSLLPFVLPSMPSCPDAVAEFHLRQAAIEFCQRTTAWRDWQGDINVLADTTRYDFVLDAEARVTKLLMVLLDDQEVRIVGPELGRQLDAREATESYAYGELASFEIRPQPEVGLVLRTFSALMPSETATTLPTGFFRYFESIAEGAKARLFATPGTDWYQPNEADRSRRRFDSRIASVASATRLGHAKPRRDPSARFY